MNVVDSSARPASFITGRLTARSRTGPCDNELMRHVLTQKLCYIAERLKEANW